MKPVRNGLTPGWLFWLLQIFGWGGLWAFYMGIVAVSGVSVPGVAAGLALNYGTGFVASSLLRLVYRKLAKTQRSLFTLIGIIIGLSFIAAQVWFWLGSLFSLIVNGPAEAAGRLDWSDYAMGLSIQGFTMLIWSVLYFAVKFWLGWRMQKERAEKADALAHSAQLQMLRYQLNPHFLFNALNSIRALIDDDKESAKQMVTELSKFLRYSLMNKDVTDVPLRDELEALRQYFSIQKIRYEERLDVIFDIDPLAESVIVPGFLLHPLAENAIKFGMQSSDSPLQIRVKVILQDRHLQIVVSNTGQWVPPAIHHAPPVDGTGTGLANVRQRLANAFPEKHGLDIEHGDGWVHVKIGIERKGDHE